MPRACTVCSRDDRLDIDGALMRGQSYRDISNRTGVSMSALHRHRHGHIASSLTETERQNLADNLGDEVRSLTLRAVAILDKAESDNDPRTALLAIRETRGLLELIGRISGDLTRASAEAIAQVEAEQRARQPIEDYKVLASWLEGFAQEQMSPPIRPALPIAVDPGPNGSTPTD